MNKLNEIEISILAGGKSSRMGQDKGLTPFCGKPMIGHVIASALQSELPVKIIANSNDYSHFGIPVISDLVHEKGPLGGLYTAMNHTRCSAVLLLSCDTPLLSADAILHLVRSVNTADVNVAAIENKLLPLFAVYSTGLKPFIKGLIDKEQLRMTALINAVNSNSIAMDRFLETHPLMFANINTMAELNEVENKM